MNADGRRRARVQGGWACSSGSSKKSANVRGAQCKPVDLTDRQRNKQQIGARSDKDRPETPRQPIWTGKNIDSPRPPQRFVFQDPDEVKLSV